MRIALERFRLTIHGDVVQPKLATGIPLFHNVEQAKPIERCTICLMPVIQVAYGNFTIENNPNAAFAVVSGGIVTQSPFMNRRAGRKSLQWHSPAIRITHLSEPAGRISPCPPAGR